MAEQVSDDSNNNGRKSKKRSADKSGFRKAPGAPKRFKSPYILFSIDRMDKHRKEMGSKTKVTSISKLVSDEWKALSEDDRKIWEEHARLDKERYNAEKSLYTGPWQVPSKRSRKDPSAPKRPMSAFLFYSQGKRQELKELNPQLKNTDISRLLGEKWKNASAADRGPHIEREKKEREVYNIKISEWRKQKNADEQAVRKHRQEVAEQWIKSGLQTHGSGVAAQVYTPGIVAAPAGTVQSSFMQMLPQQGQPPPPLQPMFPAPTHFIPHQMMPTLVPPGSDITYFNPMMAPPQQPQQMQPVATVTKEGPGKSAPASTQTEAPKVPTPPIMIPEAPSILGQPVAGSTGYPPAPIAMYNYFQVPFDSSQHSFNVPTAPELQHYHHAVPLPPPQQQQQSGH